MRPWLAATALLTLVVQLHAAPAPNPVIQPDSVVQVDFSNPELSPPQWTLVLRPDGSGHFRSQMGQVSKAGLKEIEAPNVDRDIQVSKEFAGRVFETAAYHNWFNVQCESRLKVAFQGWKTFTYAGSPAHGSSAEHGSSPQHGSSPEHGSCTFNYSRDKDIQSLGESMMAVAQTILEGARLELLLQHDRLGLDQEMELLTEEFQDGRAQEVDAIHDILERLAQDDQVLERVRKRAQSLLARGPA